MKPVSWLKIALGLEERWYCHRKGLCWFRIEFLECFFCLGVNVSWAFGEDSLMMCFAVASYIVE